MMKDKPVIKITDTIYVGRDVSYEFAKDKIYVTSNIDEVETPFVRVKPKEDDGWEGF